MYVLQLTNDILADLAKAIEDYKALDQGQKSLLKETYKDPVPLTTSMDVNKALDELKKHAQNVSDDHSVEIILANVFNEDLPANMPGLYSTTRK